MGERITSTEESREFKRQGMVIIEQPQSSFKTERPAILVLTQHKEIETGNTYFTEDNEGKKVEVVHSIAATVDTAKKVILPGLKEVTNSDETVLFNASRVLQKSHLGLELTSQETALVQQFRQYEDALHALKPLVTQQDRKELFVRKQKQR